MRADTGAVGQYATAPARTLREHNTPCTPAARVDRAAPRKRRAVRPRGRRIGRARGGRLVGCARALATTRASAPSPAPMAGWRDERRRTAARSRREASWRGSASRQERMAPFADSAPRAAGYVLMFGLNGKYVDYQAGRGIRSRSEARRHEWRTRWFTVVAPLVRMRARRLGALIVRLPPAHPGKSLGFRRARCAKGSQRHRPTLARIREKSSDFAFFCGLGPRGIHADGALAPGAPRRPAVQHRAGRGLAHGARSRASGARAGPRGARGRGQPCGSAPRRASAAARVALSPRRRAPEPSLTPSVRPMRIARGARRARVAARARPSGWRERGRDDVRGGGLEPRGPRRCARGARHGAASVLAPPRRRAGPIVLAAEAPRAESFGRGPPRSPDKKLQFLARASSVSARR